MERTLLNSLIEWKNQPNQARLPLLLYGARQVGKTFLLNQFGQAQFSNTVYLNFEKDPELQLILI